MLRWFFALWAILVVALPMEINAQTTLFVRPGDTGQLELPVANATDSDGDMEGVTVEVAAVSNPAAFRVLPTSILGPMTIPPAAPGSEPFVFRVDYEIPIDAFPPDAPDGTIEVTFRRRTSNENVIPPTRDTLVSFETPMTIAENSNLRMLNRHLWELRGEVSMVVEQIVIERNEVAKEKRRASC